VRALAATAVLALGCASAAGAQPTLVATKPAAAPLLRAAGARPVAPDLSIWRTTSPALVARLRRAGLLRAAEPERPLVRADAAPPFTDPLVDHEWWLTAIGALDQVPPGPGRPVTVIDSGLDVSHEEFAGRPNLSILNQQSTFARDEDHGTEVASVIGAPANGVGIVGVYPQAELRVWDASPFRIITNADAIAGLDAATVAGASVINLSWGSSQRDPMLEQAVEAAVRGGSLVVAAAGNERDGGDPVIYPASLPHVLTVGATDQANALASFSSSSPGLDLVAPGVAIPVADPISLSGYSLSDGTSFSSPIVAGSAAWIWTVRPELDAGQLFELIRRSAHDLGPPGWDPDTGFGLLDMHAALAAPAPLRDPQEPNDDVAEVRPGVTLATGGIVLAAPAQLAGRLDGVDDPRDVYRLRIPAHRRVRVTAAAADGRPLAVSIWSAAASTVVGTTRNRLASGANVTAATARKAGFTGYAEVAVAPGRRIEYRLTVTSTAAR
jgi:subtilisin family serine protease